MMRYFSLASGKIFFWEFVQNFPLLLGFIFSAENMKHKDWSLMLLTATLGSVIGALLIRYTEKYIVPDEQEPVKVTVTNGISFFVIMLGVAWYFAQSWSSWSFDIFLGALIGFGVGYAQDLAANKKTPGIRHILALMFAFAPALIVIRLLMDRLPPFLTVLILTTFMTGVIVVIDYLQPGKQKLSVGHQNLEYPR